MDAATRKVFEQLCAHVKTKGTVATMTRAALCEATGLPEEDLRDVLGKLSGPTGDQNLSVCFVGRDSDKLTLGISWAQKCGVK